MQNPDRDCEHGRQKGKCADCDLVEITGEADSLAMMLRIMCSKVKDTDSDNLKKAKIKAIGLLGKQKRLSGLRG